MPPPWFFQSSKRLQNPLAILIMKAPFLSQYGFFCETVPDDDLAKVSNVNGVF